MNDARKIQLGDLNFVESLREQTRACGGEIVEEDGVILMRGKNPHPLHNNVVRLDPAVDAAQCIERAHAYYGALGHGFILGLLNGQECDDLAQAAAAAGLVALQAPPAMFSDRRLADQALPQGCGLVEVSNEDQLHDYAVVSRDAWATYGIPESAIEEIFCGDRWLRLPHVRAVVGYWEDRAAAAALVVFSHGIAGVYWVGTVPGARGRGLGEACTRAVTNIGFDAGSPLVTLQASPMGEPIYLRMGYYRLGCYRLCVHPGRGPL